MDLTPTEAKMMKVLEDGNAHTHAELMNCLWDELSDKSAMKVHVSNLRKKLKAEGKDILGRHGYYALVRLMNAGRDG